MCMSIELVFATHYNLTCSLIIWNFFILKGYVKITKAPSENQSTAFISDGYCRPKKIEGDGQKTA